MTITFDLLAFAIGWFIGWIMGMLGSRRVK